MIDTGESFEDYTTEMIGKKVRVQTPEGIETDIVDETYCPICEAHCIGTIAFCGGFLARHQAYHQNANIVAVIGT